MGKKHSKVILFSGGWDSTLCALIHKDADLLFVYYGQRYAKQEQITAELIANELNKKITWATKYLGHDAKDRNLNLIMIAKNLGYDEVIVGIRNVLPIFDKYKDSNWWTLRKFGKQNNIKITMPIIGYNKKRIVNMVKKTIKTIPFNCYKEGALNCECVNCKEMRKIFK